MNCSSTIRDALMSMSLVGNTTSGSALLHAILAYSSLHGYGLSEQAIRLKIQALHYLSTSVQESQISTASAPQLVATSMLLGSFETLRPSESSGEWLSHVSGAMDVIQATQLDAQPYNCDTYHLLDWTNYHYTLCRFSQQYWHHKSPGYNVSLSLTRYKPNMPSVNPSYAILNLLSEVSDTLVDPRDPKGRSPEYVSSLKRLEARLVDIEATPIPDDSGPVSAFAIELYRVATRIYMTRVSDSPWDAPSILDDVIDALFNGPVKTCTCEHFFPLLILACEARRDDQRLAILNLIDRTQRDARIRSIKGVTDAIHAIWVHQDLHADSDVLVNYLDLLSVGISASSTIPSFA
ncbi:hypothetical protein F53441_6423 [Fusarium austroafricanum]|uniref:Uncharacterized protein n=1 Tax=Fusarium austroafricanum TaxID=2364996 RepID=A0A8H4KIP8_9HYPO|nr:hypothetical protein F53441_6423 [Fusarium austroafricanum]